MVLKKNILKVDISDKAEEIRNKKFIIISAIMGLFGSGISVMKSVVDWMTGEGFNAFVMLANSVLSFIVTFGVFMLIFLIIVKWIVHFHYLNEEYLEFDCEDDF